jgi:hypothetical protein
MSSNEKKKQPAVADLAHIELLPAIGGRTFALSPNDRDAAAGAASAAEAEVDDQIARGRSRRVLPSASQSQVCCNRHAIRPDGFEGTRHQTLRMPQGDLMSSERNNQRGPHNADRLVKASLNLVYRIGFANSAMYAACQGGHRNGGRELRPLTHMQWCW